MDRKLKKKTWTIQKIVYLLLGTGFLSFVVYLIFFADNRSKLNVDREKLTISTVEYGEFQEFIPVTGTVLPGKTIYLDAVEGGIIKQISEESGAVLEKGEIILELSNSDLELSVLSQQTNLYEQLNRSATTRLSLDQNDLEQQRQLAEIDYQLQLSRPQYHRFKSLFEKQLISKREYEEIKEQYDYNLKRKRFTYESYQKDSIARVMNLRQLEASEQRMRMSLDGVNQILDNLVVRSPINGQLSTPELEIGQSIAPGERLGQVDVLDSYKSRVKIDELYLPRIDTGQIGTFQFDGDNYTMKITKIYPNINEGRFEVDMEFVGPEPSGIKRGQSLRIRLELSKSSEALLLAMGGFYKDTGGNWVYVVEEGSNKAVRQDIRLGRKNNENFEVLDGLSPSQRVITSSYEHFGDNEVLILN